MMNKWTYWGILSLILLSCNTEVGENSKQAEEKNDVEKKLATKSDGLSYDAVELYLFDAPAMSNTFRIGERMEMNIIDITGLVANEGKYNLGMSILVISAIGDTVANEPDLFKVQSLSYDIAEKVNIPFYLDFFKPYKPNTSYMISLDIWDKVGGKHTTIEREIEVLPSQSNGFAKVEGNIELDYLLVYRNARPYTGNNFVVGETIINAWQLNQAFLDKSPAVRTKVQVFNNSGEIVFSDAESATLEPSMSKVSNKIYLDSAQFPVGSYIFKETFEAVNSKDNLIITYGFEIEAKTE